MGRRSALLCVIVALLAMAATGCGAGGRRPGPPTVLLIVVDCLRGDALGLSGYERQTSPNLDRLASRGTAFTSAFSPSSWTRPVLPTLFTGLHPAAHGLTADVGRANKARTKVLPPEVPTLAESMAALGYRTALIGEQYMLAKRFGLHRGFEYYKPFSGNAHGIHRTALRWLGWRQEEPVFVMLHYLDAHWPYCPPPSSRGNFLESPTRVKFCEDWRAVRREIRNGTLQLKPRDVEEMRARYDEEIAGWDVEIGRFLAELEAIGRLEEALIVVTSDHGEEFFEHGGMGHGATLFDEVIHVPLIIKAPDSWQAPSGQRIGELVDTTDVAATLLDAAGGSPEAGFGQSLLPWVLGEEGPTREVVVSNTEKWLAVRSEDLKLIIENETNEAQLFDLSSDPMETSNVAEGRPADVAALQEQLRRWKAGLLVVEPVAVQLGADTVEGLRALGYVD